MPLKFGTKIILSLTLFVLLTAIVALSLLAFLRVNDAALREMRHSYEQTLAIKTIASAANDYSEQIAELLILGPEATEVDLARDVLLEAVGNMETSIRSEIDGLAGSGDSEEIRNEEAELAVMDNLRAIIAELDIVRRRIEDSVINGAPETARRVYRDDVENRLDDMLDRMLDISVARETEEVVGAIADMDVLIDRMRASAYGLMALMVTLVVLVGVVLLRSVLRPVKALSEGTDAVARGDLTHRVRVAQRDELGRLADRFNAMTDEIEKQRDALLAAKTGLEAEVAERTAELRQAAARQKALAEARARVLADLSHELRTPLTVLRGKAEVTLGDPDAGLPEARAALQRIGVKAEQMSRLVEDMLFVARSEAGAIPIERRPVAMQDVLADTLLDSQELSRRKDIRILSHQPTDPVLVQGDRDRLRQAILIALDNAVRIAPVGSSVQVTLVCKADRVEVVVADEGPGFATEEVERIFNRFWRGPAREGQSGRGSGLGLAIARWIMEQHGGGIAIETRPEGGATVRFDMPRVSHCADRTAVAT